MLWQQKRGRTLGVCKLGLIGGVGGVGGGGGYGGVGELGMGRGLEGDWAMSKICSRSNWSCVISHVMKDGGSIWLKQL